MKRLIAFTLAEVLIVMGIVGTITVITLPTLKSNVQERETVAKLKKAYLTIDSAYQNVITKSEVSPATVMSYDNEKLGRLIASELRVKTDCGIDADTNLRCLYSPTAKWKWSEDDYDGFPMNGEDLYKVRLDDGTAVIISNMYIYVDPGVQGMGRNSQFVQNDDSFNYCIWGIHMFMFKITEKGIVPLGTPGVNGYNNSVETNCLNNNRGEYCTAYVIKHGKMDYISSGRY